MVMVSLLESNDFSAQKMKMTDEGGVCPLSEIFLTPRQQRIRLAPHIDTLSLTTSTALMMAPTDSSDTNTWAVQHVLALVEIWALVAQRSGFVGAWRLTGVCRASRAGLKEWLGTLPGLVMSGGLCGYRKVSEVWRLDLAMLQWVSMPALVAARCNHACCMVRGALVVLGGYVTTDTEEKGSTLRVEILSAGGQDRVFTEFPSLSCGGIDEATAIAVEESNSSAGHRVPLFVMRRDRRGHRNCGRREQQLGRAGASARRLR
jgi:hypothetical protein